MGLLDDKDEFRWGDAAAGFSRSVAIDPLGAPVDAINWGINQGYQLLGLPEVKKPFGGSEWIADLYRNYTPYKDNPGSKGDKLGEMAGTLAPLIASGGVLSLSKVGREGVGEIFDVAKGYITGNRSNLSTEQLDNIRYQLERIEKGYPASKIKFTNIMSPTQFAEYQKQRKIAGLGVPTDNVFLIDFPHIKNERMFQDDYSAKDVYEQIKSATSRKSEIIVNLDGKPDLRNPILRNDGYGNMVNDTLGFGKNNKPLIRTVYPKGDGKKDLPRKKKQKGLLE